MNSHIDTDLKETLADIFTDRESALLLEHVKTLKEVSVPHTSLKAKILAEPIPARSVAYSHLIRNSIIGGCVLFLLIFLPTQQISETDDPPAARADYTVLLDAFNGELFADDILYFEDSL